MIRSLSILLGLQLLGEIIVVVLHAPIPGPVVGMLLLFGGLLWRGNVAPDLQQTAQGLLKHLGLLFVPAGVGVMAYFDLIRASWVWILMALVGTTLLAMAVTAWTMQLLTYRLKR